MTRRRRPELAAEARRLNQEQLARLGGELRASRKRRRLTQAQLGEAVGVVQSTISRLERGKGGSLSLDLWQRAFAALDRRLIVDGSRDPSEEPADAGHLAIQELILRTAKAAGFSGTFELAIRPAESRHSADVRLRSDPRRLLILTEAWNTFGDIGAGARSFTWKLARAEEAAIAIGGDRPYRVRGCWVVRATARNRELVARYPHIFESRFPGSSVGWVQALATGREPPEEPGLVWCDVASTRMFAWRRR